MRVRPLQFLTVLCALTASSCAGNAYLPNSPGGAHNDLSGQNVRDQWLTEHPDVDPAIGEGIWDGVFVPGMTLEHRDVITNPDRRATTGDGYWRSRDLGDEIRYQWFVGGERSPFKDGNENLVCELLYVGDHLREVRYCGSTG